MLSGACLGNRSDQDEQAGGGEQAAPGERGGGRHRAAFSIVACREMPAPLTISSASDLTGATGMSAQPLCPAHMERFKSDGSIAVD